MKKITLLKQKGRFDYHRKHDLTDDEIRKSPLFENLNEKEIADVKATLKQMCQILLETIENQHTKLELDTDKCHIATGQLIEFESFKNKAA
ncbi:MAG: hypothetical protein EWV91_13035 [Microcystis aeruginosa Ma_QC_Ca_00000000_S207]|uniref:Uncharacterized protein n=1 Tax=Microcystis aeruginosa Ma_QC_Ca_00000000_S207 TaxID=2486251 RepID=A0A552FHS5_MICAE|nr:MAG: hypothetical protein EWV91_13035 [Microcystis aeruginosa Ma_QC_Ca_00000000_S207]